MRYANKMNSMLVFVNTRTVERLGGKEIVAGAAPANTSQATESSVAQNVEKTITHASDPDNKRIVTITKLNGAVYESVRIGVDYDCIFKSPTETVVKKLTSGSDSNIKVNVLI